MKKIISDKSGQSMLEFALVLPILILLLMGIMDFGRLFASYVELQNAARDGARYAALQKQISQSDLETRVKSNLVILNKDQSGFTIKLTYSNSTKPELVDVTLDYPMKMMTPIIGDIIGSPVNLHSKMDMRVEWGG